MSLPKTTDLILHLDAEAITGFTNNDTLTSWSDLSAQNHNAVQVGTEPRPTYKDDGTYTYVNFAGNPEENLVATGTGADVDNFDAITGNPFTLIIAFRYGGTDGVICGSAGGIGTGTTFAVFMEAGNLKVRHRGTTAAQTVASGVTQGGDWHILTIVWNDTNSYAYYDGGSAFTLPIGTGSNQGYDFFIGSCRAGLSNYNHFYGDLGEVIVYDTAINSTEQEDIEQYLGEKWLGWAPLAPYWQATGNGNVTDDGGATITERGVCWATTANPTTADSKSISAGTTGAFTADITGLTADTLYYVRAYAINRKGTSYGEQVSFTTEAGAPTSPVSLKQGGVFGVATTKVKVGGTFQDVTPKIKVGGVFK